MNELSLELMRIGQRQVEKGGTAWQCVLEHYILGNAQDTDVVEVSHYEDHCIVVLDCERRLWTGAKREEMVAKNDFCADLQSWQ